MLVVLIIAAAALLSALLIVALKPLLVRYALARPNARSSHRVPTPQGGGIAVLGATILVGLTALAAAVPVGREVAVLFLAAAGLALVGALDDIRPQPAWLRLLLQIAAVGVVVVSGPRLLPLEVPLALEWTLLTLAGVWFVNLVNFMDGLDWITVAEFVPLLGCLVALAAARGTLPVPMLVAASLLGALLGFAPFNRPVARLFLGDVGSLPIGLIVGWLLLKLAGSGAFAAAVLLPLYYLADATITLLRRLLRGERVWEAHRSHFYQQATDNGFTVLEVSGQVFALNLALAGLAAATLIWPSPTIQALALALGSALVVFLLRRFAQPRLKEVAAWRDR